MDIDCSYMIYGSTKFNKSKITLVIHLYNAECHEEPIEELDLLLIQYMIRMKVMKYTDYIMLASINANDGIPHIKMLYFNCKPRLKLNKKQAADIFKKCVRNNINSKFKISLKTIEFERFKPPLVSEISKWDEEHFDNIENYPLEVPSEF